MTSPDEPGCAPSTGERPRKRLLWRFGWNLCLLTMRTLFREHRAGIEHMPDRGPVLIVSNHQSHLDPVAIGMCVTRRETHFVARDSLFHIPLFGALIRAYNAVPIKRGEGDAAGVRAVLDRLASGAAVLVFPEGTRTRDGRTAPFKRGVVLLIKRARCPVVPAAVEGAFDAWPRSRKLPLVWGKRIAAQLGEPIAHEELLKDGPDAAMERLHGEIEAMRLSLRATLREQTNGRYPPPGAGDGSAVEG
jgi:1-acyl-sn-glycerol-3-phosphate acyltransferase